MSSLLRDLRGSLRLLTRQPVLSLAAVVAFALAVGPTGAILGVVHAALVQPVAFPAVPRLMDVMATRHRSPDDRSSVTPADFLAWRERSTSFESLGAYTPLGDRDLTGAGEPERLHGHLVTAGYFAALGVRPALGRTFVAAEERPGRDRVAVLSQGLWRHRFAGDPGIVGRTLTLDGEPYTVVGVMPAGFGARGGPADLWTPLAFGPARPADRESAYLGLVGRLRAGVTPRQAQAEMDAIAAGLAREVAANRGLSASVLPLAEVMTRAVRPAVRVLLLAGAGVLLIAGVDVACLLLARALSRRRELAVRAALGASSIDLARLLLVDGLVLAAGGGALGIVLALGMLQLLPDLRGIYLYPQTQVGLNLWVMGWTLAAALAAGLLAGLVPALQAARPRVAALLAAGSITSSGGGRRSRWALDLLAVSEIALSALLLVAAGLLLHSLLRLTRYDRGYEPRRLLTLEIALPAARYPAEQDVATFYGSLLARLAALPGVTAAAASNDVPGEGWGLSLRTPESRAGEEVSGRFLLVTPGFFRATGIPVLRGRALSAADRLGARPVLVLNRAAAAALFGAADPVGKRVAFDGPQDWREVVGVVGDVGDPQAGAPGPAAYIPFLQEPTVLRQSGVDSLLVLVRTAGPPLALAAAARAEVAALDRLLPASNLSTLEDRLAAGVARPRLGALALGALAVLALALAAVGVFGVLLHGVEGRRREIGIRLALGADRGRVVRLVMGHGLALAAGGLALGLAGALAAGRLLASLLYGIGPRDPMAYGAATLLLGLVALAACWLPARRAAGLDPVRSLRAE